jgi:hypothetical protein
MRKTILPFIVFLAAACSEPRKQEASVSEVMPNIPLPPASQIIGREAGSDAVKIRFRSAMDADSVGSYYRLVLGQRPWRLISDIKAADGTITLYAQQDGPPLWVSIRRAPGSAGSFVDLMGAKPR